MLLCPRVIIWCKQGSSKTTDSTIGLFSTCSMTSCACYSVQLLLFYFFLLNSFVIPSKRQPWTILERGTFRAQLRKGYERIVSNVYHTLVKLVFPVQIFHLYFLTVENYFQACITQTYSHTSAFSSHSPLHFKKESALFLYIRYAVWAIVICYAMQVILFKERKK